VPLLTIANAFFQPRQEIKRNIRWLELLRISVSDVVHQRPQRGRTRRRNWNFSRNQRSRMNPCQHPGCDGFDVPLHSANLPGEQDCRMLLHLLH